MLGAAWAGAPGVLIGQAAGGIVFAGIAYVLAIRVMGGDHKADQDTFAREGRLHRLFNHRH